MPPISAPLLSTKLYAPPPGESLVQRERLLQQIDKGPPLILVSASAGFGKSMLMADYCSRFEGTSAWLSLDAGDNEATNFWRYVVAAIRQANPELCQGTWGALQSGQSAPVDAIVALLLNELLGAAPLLLVLDDLHTVHDADVLRSLRFFLDRLPPGIRVAILTRADPAIGLARRRARRQILEIRTADLRFDPHETTALFDDVLGLDLDYEDVNLLQSRTEGWITGLRMAGFSLEVTDNPHAFVKAFSGDDRFIADYFADEVLSQQPKELQEFFLRTCLLQRMCGPLCQAVIGSGDAQAIIEDLERRNLFVVPLDSTRTWYRYHHLFARLLQHHLERPGREAWRREVYERASIWCETQQLWGEALGYALASENSDRLARLAAGNILSMLDFGGLVQVSSWLEGIPASTIQEDPWLRSLCLYVSVYQGRLDGIHGDLRQVLALVEDNTDQESVSIRAYVEVLHGYTHMMSGAMPQAEMVLRRALELIKPRDAALHNFAMMLLGNVIRWQGRFPEAVAAYSECEQGLKHHPDSHTASLLAGSLAEVLICMGRLNDAAAACKRGIERSAGSHCRGYPMAHLSRVLAEQGHTDEAEPLAHEAAMLCDAWGQPDIAVMAMTSVEFAVRAAGDVEGAELAVRVGERHASGTTENLERYIRDTHALHWIFTGDLNRASLWAEEEEFSGPQDRDYVRGRHLLNYACLLVVRGDYGEALRLLEGAYPELLKSGAGGLQFLVLRMMALSYHALGKVDEAMQALEKALAIAEPEHMVQSFVELGAPMASLLYEALQQGIGGSYVGELLTAFPAGSIEDEQASADVQVANEKELIEPLSERELEVLALIAEGCSNREIAERLYITPGTAKVHASRIYAKLGVSSRTQAASRARLLGLVP